MITQGVYFKMILRQSFFDVAEDDRCILEATLRRMGFFPSWSLSNPGAEKLRQVNVSVAHVEDVRKMMLGEIGNLVTFYRFAPYIEQIDIEVGECPPEINYSYGCRGINAPRSLGYKFLLWCGRRFPSLLTCIITQGKASVRLNISHPDDAQEGIRQLYYALGELHFALSSLNRCRLIEQLIKEKRQYNGAAREAKQFADKVLRELIYQPI